MLTITVGFSLPHGYQSPFVSLDSNEHALTFTLQEGTHTATSESVNLGVIHGFEGRSLKGQFSFHYTYDGAAGVITVCGTDFDSADSLCLTTVPEGTDEVCRQRAADGGFLAEDRQANPHWNYLTPLTPGLKEVLAGIVRAVNDRLIAALEQEPGLIVQVRKHPPVLPADLHQQLLVVYRNGEFLGLHEPGQTYGPGDVAVTVESVFGGEVTLNYAEQFANVIGSTNDPKIAGLSWIQLWANQFGVYPVVCTSYQSNGFPCGNALVGGHVIAGNKAKYVAAGSNAVWIFPICVQHNNNDNVYMEALMYLKGIWLKNYLGW